MPDKKREGDFFDAVINDPFYYMAILTTGHVLYFDVMRPIDDVWVHLDTGDPKVHKQFPISALYNSNPTLDRGITVRRSEIAAIAKAPFGS